MEVGKRYKVTTPHVSPALWVWVTEVTGDTVSGHASYRQGGPMSKTWPRHMADKWTWQEVGPTDWQ